METKIVPVAVAKPAQPKSPVRWTAATKRRTLSMLYAA